MTAIATAEHWAAAAKRPEIRSQAAIAGECVDAA